MSINPTIKALLLIGLVVLLSACVRTEPRLNAPHINLSPDAEFTVSQTNNDSVVDFGIDVSANESDSLENLEILPGVRVRRVEVNSSAAAAELKAGDVILAVDNVDTNHPDTFYAQLQGADTNQTLAVKARRDTTVFTTSLTGQTRTQATIEELYRVDPIMSRAGFKTVQVQAGGQTATGAKVVELFPQSPLPESGLSIDNTILTVDTLAVESAQGLVNYLMSKDYGDKVEFQYLNSQNAITTTTLTLWDPGFRVSHISLWPLVSYDKNTNQATTRFNILKIGPISIFEYRRKENEKRYKLLTLFNFGTGTGELIEEDNRD